MPFCLFRTVALRKGAVTRVIGRQRDDKACAGGGAPGPIMKLLVRSQP